MSNTSTVNTQILPWGNLLQVENPSNRKSSFIDDWDENEQITSDMYIRE